MEQHEPIDGDDRLVLQYTGTDRVYAVSVSYLVEVDTDPAGDAVIGPRQAVEFMSAGQYAAFSEGTPLARVVWTTDGGKSHDEVVVRQ